MTGCDSLKTIHKITIVSPILSTLIILSGCGYVGLIDKTSTPQAEVLMLRQLPNGQSEVVEEIPIEGEMNDWLHHKESELRPLIAERVKLDSDDVLIQLAPKPNENDTGVYDILCSVILVTESSYEREILNKVVEDINRHNK